MRLRFGTLLMCIVLAAASAAGAASIAFEVGDTVEGQWTNGDWYPGKIGAINADGTYRVDYFDGDVSPALTASQVKAIDISIDAATRARVVDAAAAKLADLYVFPDVAKKMERALRDHQQAGAYDAVGDGIAFAALLTEQLRAVSHDRHLSVGYSSTRVPEQPSQPSDEDKARFRARLERVNCGFDKTERIDGDIGYVKLDMFAELDPCAPKATAAFGALGDVSALIIDLRENGGGRPEMVAFVSSYLFAQKTHLNDIHDRAKDETRHYWTTPNVPGTKLVEQPVYVLTSKRTFSAAEEFAYNLKHLKRATIVGETTGGGAHPTMSTRLDDHFLIGVPYARAINPITKTNWEGTGVEPDVSVPADQALETAKRLAVEQIAKRKARR